MRYCNLLFNADLHYIMRTYREPFKIYIEKSFYNSIHSRECTTGRERLSTNMLEA